MAMCNDPGGLCHARAFRSHLCGKRWGAASTGHASPGDSWGDGKVYRRSDRTLCRSLSGMAFPCAGHPADRDGSAHSLCGEGLPGTNPQRDPDRERTSGTRSWDSRFGKPSSKKIPYMLVVGDREEKEETLSPRKRSGEAMKAMKIEEFVSLVQSEYPKL